jgi:hypothetical protein
MDKEQLAIARLQDAARLSEHRYEKPLMVTYSGGKDSQVLVTLAERAGINFEVINSHTTADAPETVYFIREQFKAMEERGIKCSIVMPRYKDKPVSMWTLIPQKLMPPTRLVRYCCADLKENILAAIDLSLPAFAGLNLQTERKAVERWNLAIVTRKSASFLWETMMKKGSCSRPATSKAK